ncbi:hypothetical protein AM493_02165 [Flavobacterium akiainvivens]|uniref:Uncharacterized protein n=1 Tax=Flavobacterium akiainvivens TaxID=1202724 RepID=A0A0M9VGY6_9FLAO|nr:flavodoxin family protein [Flavobacterium akiainvivens]KOS04976.1 hypothetical protein AM493_02165 [Flavobacterium akiainvivens]SFQ41132.1 hypothetical protein SAMN05444144_10486 [Flavobacterium akiainvivens]
MNRFLLVFLLIAAKAFCQINPADSTVQVVAYWDKNEAHSYSIVHEKLKVKGTDTTVTFHVDYKVDITIKDSTENSYTVEWKYRDFKSADKSASSKTAGLVDGLTVRFKTNEMGEYEELLNWKEINEHLKKSIANLEKTTKLPPFFIKSLKTINTRESVEEGLLVDIQQFHSFYGTAMTLGEEISDTSEEAGDLGIPVKSELYLVLEEIDFEDEAYLIKFFQTYDDESVQSAMGEFIGDFLGTENTKAVTASGFEDYYGAYIHTSGWPYNMFYQRDMTINGETNIETRAIAFE